MIVAIDGPAASGKGTLGKRVAAYYGLAHLDTGTLYRAVARDTLAQGGDPADSAAAAAAARALDPASFWDPHLRAQELGETASVVARHPEVREVLLAYQRAFARRPEGAVLDGRTAFALHDTYGFPFELTAEIAAEKGVEVDVDAFTAEMDAQRERARAAVKDESWKAYGGAVADLLNEIGPTEFVGYALDEADSTVVALLRDGVRVDSLAEGEQGDLVLAKTPFYGEQGGQVGDTGVIDRDGARFVVEDTKVMQGLITHVGRVENGSFNAGDAVTACIDVMRRERIRRNHTATHLLHWALRLVLGDHAKQAGSYVAPDRLRFDFTHFEAMNAEQLAKVERLVNAKIFENHSVRAYETSIASAREAGVTALFGEKYGDFVRVLEVGNFSKELCGGTHVGRTSEIGFLKVTGESSVGANLRRIEAVTSFDAYELVLGEEGDLAKAAAAFKVPAREVAERAAQSVKRLKELEAGTARGAGALAAEEIDRLATGATDAGYRLVVGRAPSVQPGALRSVWDALRTKGVGAAVLVTSDPETGKPIFLAAGDEAAVAAGFDAGRVVREIAPILGGRGGGKAAMAQGGGENAEGIDEALAAARGILGAS